MDAPSVLASSASGRHASDDRTGTRECGAHQAAQRRGVKTRLVGEREGRADNACGVSGLEARLPHTDEGAMTFQNARTLRFCGEPVRPRSSARKIHAASPNSVPDLLALLLVQAWALRPCSSLVAQRVAAGQGAGQNFLRERSLVLPGDVVRQPRFASLKRQFLRDGATAPR